MAQLFVDGQNVVPARLQRERFVFAYPALREALRSLI
jgi:NAD dependent epimerase/dehydratase family enzyme